MGKSGIIGAQLQMLILNCMREKRQGGINGMLDRVIRFFRFDRRNGEYELLETEEELTCPACGNSFPINDFGSEEE